MVGFFRTGNALVCDGVSLEDTARAHGTPLYVYSAASIRHAYRELDQAFAAHPHRIHYAMKANSSLAVVRLLRDAGSAVDANSIGEVELAMRAGFAPEDIVFSGVGKSPDEIERAVQLGLKAINAESAGELERIDRAASARGVRARVALRVNPDIDAGSHPNISTGLRINKFGVPLQEARAIYRERRDRAGLSFVGVHVHIGSQITSTEPLRRAAHTLATLALELKDDGFQLEHLDIGGGLGIDYNDTPGIGPSGYAAVVIPELQRCGVPAILEPGRAVVGHSGALIARVVDVKRFDADRQFAVLDAGMGELIRPALYGSYHRIVPVRPRQGATSPWDVVGPICESSDVFARERTLPPLHVDDLVAILDAGAYGSVMGSNYNRHLLPAEVLVEDGTWSVIRRRQTLDDVLALET